MDDSQRRWLVLEMNTMKDFLTKQKGFINNTELKGVYVVLNTLEAAVMFNEVDPLASLCAKFCGDKADETAERN
jgi:hypothetical protein